MILMLIRRTRRLFPVMLFILATPLFAAGDLDWLIAGLDHPLWTARRDAAERLAATGPAGRDAVPQLLESLEDVQPEVRRASVRALAAAPSRLS